MLKTIAKKLVRSATLITAKANSLAMPLSYRANRIVFGRLHPEMAEMFTPAICRAVTPVAHAAILELGQFLEHCIDGNVDPNDVADEVLAIYGEFNEETLQIVSQELGEGWVEKVMASSIANAIKRFEQLERIARSVGRPLDVIDRYTRSPTARASASIMPTEDPEFEAHTPNHADPIKELFTKAGFVVEDHGAYGVVRVAPIKKELN